MKKYIMWLLCIVCISSYANDTMALTNTSTMAMSPFTMGQSMTDTSSTSSLSGVPAAPVPLNDSTSSTIQSAIPPMPVNAEQVPHSAITSDATSLVAQPMDTFSEKEIDRGLTAAQSNAYLSTLFSGVPVKQ